MIKKMPVYYSSDDSEHEETVELPSFCPKCGFTLVPYTIYSYLYEANDECNNKLSTFNFCHHCNECFISYHTYNEDDDIYLHESSAPMCYPNTNYSDNIKKLSPNFVKIFDESSIAESLGLTSICGMGYRKSLEFLIKDFAISIQPQDTNNIHSMPLARCIDQYIDNPRLKTLAKAATWIGNDQTHYVKKHMNYDIRDLKVFITAFVTFIDSDLAYQDAQYLVSNPTPSI